MTSPPTTEKKLDSFHHFNRDFARCDNCRGMIFGPGYADELISKPDFFGHRRCRPDLLRIKLGNKT